MFEDIPLPDQPYRISFLLVPNCSLFGLTAMLAPLRHANRLSGRTLYYWELLSESGGEVPTADGLALTADRAIGEVESCRNLIVCSGEKPQNGYSSAVCGFLRRLANHGTSIGSQDTGAILLAEAGVLDGYQSTVHWENLDMAREHYPGVSFLAELFVIDRRRFACSGAMAGLDMMLYLVERQHGRQLATAVADALICSRARPHNDSQLSDLQYQLDSRNPNLINAVTLMRENIEDPLTIAQLALLVDVSERELERLFKRYLQHTPNAFYRNLRLERARSMLQQSRLSVTEVAMACGFASLSHFTRCYQKQYQRRPSDER